MNVVYPQRQRELKKLIQKLGLPETAPIQWHILDLALTHPTFAPDANYEQLEFVGDAVVRLAAAQLLYELFPNCPVGEFAAIRSVLVSDRTLSQVAENYGLARYLLVAPSAAGDKAGAESRVADAFEAMLAALYLSTGTLELVRPWLDSHFQQLANEIRTDPARQNYKAALQEWTQAHYKILPVYRVKETTKVHDDANRFAAEVWLEERCLGQGTGRSIKAAQQAAAQEAFLLLQQGGNG
jgi:ribonuclease-3